MHPQVRLDGPGRCPICEMPLIPAASVPATPGETPTLELSEQAMAMASVETVPVEARPLTRELRAVGRIEYNESSLASITPRFSGYAERLFVSFTGAEIRQGDHLAEVYSPEILVAQQETLIALQAGADSTLVEVARTRLRLLGLSDEQISDLVKRRKSTDHVTLYSPISGTVIEKRIVEKAAFEAGEVLYRIANLDTVWAYLEIYEPDLPFVRYGQRVRLTVQAVPGRTFTGLVTFIQPFVNDETRTIRVPVHIENPDHALTPGMFVSAVLETGLTAEGRAAPTGVEGRYTCPMHPLVLAETEGPCPSCGMPLVRIPGEPASAKPAGKTGFACPMKCEGEKIYLESGNCPVCGMKLEEILPPDAGSAEAPAVLAVPVSAVLDSGTRRIVYVEKSRGLFEPREVALGPRAGAYFPVLAGLAAGERVVVRGGFLIDSQFQITGHPSLLHPGGQHASPGRPSGSGGATKPPDHGH
jgi:Cu(I)/Ag(I) efflux system membrane fusion protein